MNTNDAELLIEIKDILHHFLSKESRISVRIINKSYSLHICKYT